MSVLDTLRSLFVDECGGPVVTFDPTVDPADVELHVQTLAGTQTMQSDLPIVTQTLWRAVAKAFPSITGLGAWGDRSHQARKSDHNYTTTSGKRGARAVDCMTKDPAAHDRIVAWALAHRVDYHLSLIISRRRKWSAATGWRPRPYLGVSPHTDHVHLSCDA